MFGPIRETAGPRDTRLPADEQHLPVTVSRGRTMVVHAALVLFAVAILARAVQLQIVEHETWLRLADRQHVDQQTVKPLRGAIVDATGTVLVESREEVKVSIAPREIRDVRRKNAKRGAPLLKTRAELRKGLQALSVPESQIRKALDSTRKWVP